MHFKDGTIKETNGKINYDTNFMWNRIPIYDRKVINEVLG